jgi:hypothetical protein
VKEVYIKHYKGVKRKIVTIKKKSPETKKGLTGDYIGTF